MNAAMRLLLQSAVMLKGTQNTVEPYGLQLELSPHLYLAICVVDLTWIMLLLSNQVSLMLTFSSGSPFYELSSHINITSQNRGFQRKTQNAVYPEINFN